MEHPTADHGKVGVFGGTVRRQPGQLVDDGPQHGHALPGSVLLRRAVDQSDHDAGNVAGKAVAGLDVAQVPNVGDQVSRQGPTPDRAGLRDQLLPQTRRYRPMLASSISPSPPAVAC